MNFNSLKVNIKGRKYAFIIFYFKYNPSKKTLNKLNVKIMKYKLLLYLTRTFFFFKQNISVNNNWQSDQDVKPHLAKQLF